MEHDDFDDVSWRNGLERETSRPTTAVSEDDDPGVSRAYGQHGTHADGKRRSSTADPQAGRHADATDLAGVGDGRLDCTVDTPQKENDGTKDAFVSYLVTTHVRHQVVSRRPPPDRAQLATDVLMQDIRPISSLSRKETLQFGAASQTSSFYIKLCQRNTPLVLSHLFQTSTIWCTYGATDLAPISLNDELTPFTGSSNV